MENIQFRVCKIKNENQELILLKRFKKPELCFQYLQELVNSSDDDFAHEDYCAVKYTFDSNTNSWIFDDTFKRKHMGPKTAKGLIYTRKKWNDENN